MKRRRAARRIAVACDAILQTLWPSEVVDNADRLARFEEQVEVFPPAPRVVRFAGCGCRFDIAAEAEPVYALMCPHGSYENPAHTMTGNIFVCCSAGSSDP